MDSLDTKIPQVFVSHSHQDNEFCRAYVQGLRAQGLDVWYDEHNLGEGLLSQEIDRQLAVRRHFVLILSPNAIASGWVQLEYRSALAVYMRKGLETFLPIVAKPCTIPPTLETFKRIEDPDGQPVSVSEAVARTLKVIRPPEYSELAVAFQRQKELDRLKDAFISAISNELMAPMTAIEAYITLIGRHGRSLDQAKLDQLAAEIHGATNQWRRIVSMIKDASRISGEKLELTIRPLSVRPIAAQVIKSMYYVQPHTHSYRDDTARITLSIPADICVLADANHLELVFSHLLSNAVKYAPRGTIAVSSVDESRATLERSGRIEPVHHVRTNHWVVISVSDCGPGIPREDFDKLFQKFVRLPRDMSSSVGGAGLGLWLCAQYVRAMGGEIWVECEPGQGATFSFCLPASSAGL